MGSIRTALASLCVLKAAEERKLDESANKKVPLHSDNQHLNSTRERPAVGAAGQTMN